MMVNAALVDPRDARAQNRPVMKIPLFDRHRSLRLLICSTAMLAGCVATKPVVPPPVAVVLPPTKGEYWKRVADPGDATRLANLAGAWSSALGEVRSHGFSGEVRKEGALLEPRAALPRPAPSPGSYSCRMIRLGAASPKSVPFERFKPFYCYVEADGDALTIVKQTGSQRPAGRLWEDDSPNRLVYLGSLAMNGEESIKAYGDDPRRDMAGVLERVEPFRWRLVIPWPRGNSKLDVYELTPVADQPH